MMQDPDYTERSEVKQQLCMPTGPHKHAYTHKLFEKVFSSALMSVFV